jgi:hypothetical protein
VAWLGAEAWPGRSNGQPQHWPLSAGSAGSDHSLIVMFPQVFTQRSQFADTTRMIATGSNSRGANLTLLLQRYPTIDLGHNGVERLPRDQLRPPRRPWLMGVGAVAGAAGAGASVVGAARVLGAAGASITTNTFAIACVAAATPRRLPPAASRQRLRSGRRPDHRLSRGQSTMECPCASSAVSGRCMRHGTYPPGRQA